MITKFSEKFFRQINIKSAFLVVIFSLLLSGLVTGGTILILFKDPSQSVLTIPLTLILSEILLILPLIVFLKGHPTSRQILRLNSVNLTTLGIAVGLSVGLAILSDELDRLVSLVFPPPDWILSMSLSLKSESVPILILTFLGSVVLASICEELVFRGFFQQVLEQHWKDATQAVLVTSLFFAIIHMNPWWIVQIYLIGLFLGYLSWRTNSVYPSIVFHAINNTAAFGLTNWGEHIESFYIWKGHISPLFIVAGIFLTLGGIRALENHQHTQITVSPGSISEGSIEEEQRHDF